MEKQRREGTVPRNLEKAFGQVLQEVRKERGLSQEQLGFESGYHRTYISLLERGKMNPSLRTIMSLAGVLQISPGHLLDRLDAHLGRSRRLPRGERTATT